MNVIKRDPNYCHRAGGRRSSWGAHNCGHIGATLTPDRGIKEMNNENV